MNTSPKNHTTVGNFFSSSDSSKFDSWKMDGKTFFGTQQNFNRTANDTGMISIKQSNVSSGTNMASAYTSATKNPFKKRHLSSNAEGSPRRSMDPMGGSGKLKKVQPLNLFGRPTYTKNQAINQKNLENFAEKIANLDTLENCENTLYRLVPNLPHEKSNRQTGSNTGSPMSRGSASPGQLARFGETPNNFASSFTSAANNNQNKSPFAMASRTSADGFRVVKPFSLEKGSDSQ